MTGVEILATEEVATAFGFNFTIFTVVLTIITVLMVLVIGFSTYADFGWLSFFYGLIIGIVLGAIFGSIAANDQEPLEYKTQYKVTISDEVSMNDFLSKYEIIDQEGKIYTVREKDK